LKQFLSEAAKRGYKTASLTAKSTWIHDFKDIYSAALKAVDLPSCLENCARKIIAEMGYSPEEIPAGMSFMDYLTGKDLFDPITRRETRAQLNEMFFRNPRIDKNFAICAGLMTGGILGYPFLEPSSKELLTAWTTGEKGVRAPALRKLGMSPSKITKHNARHMLRSLVEVLRIAGYTGLVIGIDDLEILTGGSFLEEIRYTKMRREDAYESIRELIDEIDTLSHIMFVFAFDRELTDNESAGLKSYQALWMRVQNEVESRRFNLFADIADLDKLARQRYAPGELEMMSARLFAGQDGPAAPEGAADAADTGGMGYE
ncbi:MAG: DUF2791 family P-loop domain-containing protein, partial [Gracilibacteraceae bacterium]|nr:DUF2791 family P-loop domain-containing protein [Gracilibacteraceae bacterium]